MARMASSPSMIAICTSIDTKDQTLLCCPLAQHVDGTAQDIAQGEVGSGKGEPTGLDSGEVQDVVEACLRSVMSWNTPVSATARPLTLGIVEEGDDDLLEQALLVANRMGLALHPGGAFAVRPEYP
jgi:hypothetical protein